MGEGERMPWPVRIALGWFVLLAIACCVSCVCMLVEFCRDGAGLCEWVLGLVTCLGFISFGAGLVLAILRGKRKYMKLGTIFGDKPFKLGKDTYYLSGRWSYRPLAARF